MSHSERSFCRHCHPCMLAFLHPLQFDVCGCVGVRAIVAWVQTGSTSSECRVRFQAGASSESKGGPVSGIVCCVDFLGDHPVCQRRVGPSVSMFDALLRNVHVQPACWELFGVHGCMGAGLRIGAAMRRHVTCQRSSCVVVGARNSWHSAPQRATANPDQQNP